MPFGALSSSSQIIVRLAMVGGPQFVAGMQRAGIATNEMAIAETRLAAATARANRHQLIHNQLLFTQRRLAFYGTLAVGGLAAAVGKLGFNYLSTLQQTKVALEPFLGGQVDDVLQSLFKLAAFTPFTMQQVSDAFRRIYVGFQQLGVSAEYTRITLGHMIDALSVGGTLTEKSLRQLSMALQDLGFQGVLTGRMFQRLGQIGIPIGAILSKELGLTAEQMQHIGQLGIPATVVLEAINKFISTEPGYRGAALRQSLQTVHGLWTTILDLIGQAAGEAEKGPFAFVQKRLRGVVENLAPFYESKKPVTITAIVEAFDKELSPKTHIVINLLTTLQGVLEGIVGTFYLLGKGIGAALVPLDAILGPLERNRTVFRILGIVLGVNIGLWVAWKTTVFAASVAAGVARLSILALRGAVIATGVAVVIFNSIVRSRLIATLAVAIVLNTATAASTLGVAGAMYVATGAAIALDIALGPVGLVAAAITLTAALTVLYFRWQAFHDLVNRTIKFLVNNPLAAIFIPFIGPAIAAVGLMIKLWNVLKRIYELVKHPLRIHVSMPSARGILKHFIPDLTPGFDIPGVPFAAAGGHVISGGTAVIGDNGPELLNIPRGATITPLKGAGVGSLEAILLAPANLYLDSKKVAEGVSKYRIRKVATQ